MREAAERTLTIGAFARRARLSPKALRLYDRLGVLGPAAVEGCDIAFPDHVADFMPMATSHTLLATEPASLLLGGALS